MPTKPFDPVQVVINAGLVLLILFLSRQIWREAQTQGVSEPIPLATRPTAPATLTATPTATPTPVPQAMAVPVCEQPALAYWQHLSANGSFSETETEAAGVMVCRVRRDSCAYRLLVGNLDPQIVFKREERPPLDEEDFRMHPAMLLPLTRLRELVAAEWGGAVQLRVTDAYDSLLEHDLRQPDLTRRTSLHFEGRSIDLTTWPVDRAKYGRLCALAHCAGFDWVHHEGDHCHASVRAESVCGRCAD